MSKLLVGLDVSDEVIIDIIEGAEEQGIGYWAERSTHDLANRKLTLTEIEESTKHVVYYGDIVSAISKLVNREVSIRSDIRDAIALDLMDYRDGCRMDAECYDVIIQVATFGDVIYG